MTTNIYRPNRPASEKTVLTVVVYVLLFISLVLSQRVMSQSEGISEFVFILLPLPLFFLIDRIDQIQQAREPKVSQMTRVCGLLGSGLLIVVSEAGWFARLLGIENVQFWISLSIAGLIASVFTAIWLGLIGVICHGQPSRSKTVGITGGFAFVSGLLWFAVLVSTIGFLVSSVIFKGLIVPIKHEAAVMIAAILFWSIGAGIAVLQGES